MLLKIIRLASILTQKQMNILRSHKPPFKGERGNVVTRFPPEPSGYLHIGHAKAAILNYAYAKEFDGKFIVRFDDTNPSKERQDYVTNIIKDLHSLKIESDAVTHTSDYFDKLIEHCEKLIRQGRAYADCSDSPTISKERNDAINSKYRENSVEENIKHWEEMKGFQNPTHINSNNYHWCIRAKINMAHKNKVMRDPVIYRINQTPHHITKTKYCVYPTYDFACPIVDSIEGVTHAGRSVEYRDRNELYNWILQETKLRKVEIFDFSRLSMVNTLLSKRKIQYFIDNKHVENWADPRLPTIQGIMRRGLTADAITQFILEQGASHKTVLMEWDKIWKINRDIIDSYAKRYSAVGVDTAKRMFVKGDYVLTKMHPYHPKSSNLGLKQVYYSSDLLVEDADVSNAKIGQKMTLMKWGNCIVSDISEKGIFVDLKLQDNNYKDTKKISWIPNLPEKIIKATIVEYDHLILKKTVREEDKLEELINHNSKLCTQVYLEHDASQLKQGDVIQIERRGYYYVDSDVSTGSITLNYIPDGSISNVSKIPTKINIFNITKGKNT